MPLYSPSEDFVSRLRAFDPDLRVRWSDGQNRWRVERKVTRGSVWPPSAHESPAQQEDRRAADEGYILVGTLKHGELGDRVFVALAKADLWRHGGAAKVADGYDEADKMAEQMARLRRADRFEALARERWRYMNRVRTVPESARHTAPAGGMSIN